MNTSNHSWMTRGWTGHSFLQLSSTFSKKVGKMAETQLVASVVLQ